MSHKPSLKGDVTLGTARFTPIAQADLPRISSALRMSGCMLWAAYPPFLMAYGASPARDVLVGETHEALIVLVHRKIRKQLHLDLLVPPLCADPAAVMKTLSPLLTEYNGELETRILWADLPLITSPVLADTWRFQPYEREYVYSRSDVLAMNGHAFRMLRKRVNRCEREILPDIRPFTSDDVAGCVDLLGRWQDAREDDCAPVFDYGYTRAAIESAGLTDSVGRTDGLIGLVAEVDGKIAAFAFGGAMTDTVGNFFLLKNDPALVGLAETMRVELIRALEGCTLINDAGDLDRPGLAQHKNMFRPVAFVPTWKGNIVR